MDDISSKFLHSKSFEYVSFMKEQQLQELNMMNKHGTRWRPNSEISI